MGGDEGSPGTVVGQLAGEDVLLDGRDSEHRREHGERGRDREGGEDHSRQKECFNFLVFHQSLSHLTAEAFLLGGETSQPGYRLIIN